MTRSASVWIWISGYNTTSSLSVFTKIFSWAFWCFPTCKFSKSYLNINLGWCLHFGWDRNLPGEGDRFQHNGDLPWHVDVCFLRLRFRFLWRGFSAPIPVAGLQRVLSLLTPTFWLCFELNLGLTRQAWVVSRFLMFGLHMGSRPLFTLRPSGTISPVSLPLDVVE